MRDAVTQERLKFLLSYDPNTGVFVWQNPPKQHAGLKGEVAGTPLEGYVTIGIDGTVYRAHRLAWLWVYGKWPTQVDHINRVKNDNRIDNLRECTHSENTKNHGQTFNGSGLPVGVRKTSKRYFAKRPGYQARITCDGNQIHIGTFATIDEAAVAYLEKRAELFGEFCP